MATAGCGIGGSWMSLMMMKKKKKPSSSSSISYSSSVHTTTTTTMTTLTFFTSSHRQLPPPPRHHLLLLPRAAQTNNNNNPSPPPPPPDLCCGYLPDANFYKIEAILRPWRVPQVSSALLKMGIRGVTVSGVRGFGAQGGLTERQAGSEYSEDKFLAKVKMEIVVSKEQVEAVIDKIIEEARTGEIGDGKIFLLPVTDVIRVRTGERGENAERMLGGRSDMSSSV